MKQFTKLLSVLLALVMLFGVSSIGVNAAVRRYSVITKSNVEYDSIDNAALTPEQVATIICDALDKTLLEEDIVEEISLGLTSITIDLTSLDKMFSSLYDTLNNPLVGVITVGDIKYLEENQDLLKGYTRAGNGDLVMIRQLIGFLSRGSNVQETLSKLAYGIENGDGSIDLALAGGFIDKEDLEMFADLPAVVRGLLFDELLLGSYAYPEEDDLEYYFDTPANFYEEWDDLFTKPFTNTDDVLNKAIFNMLTTPQDKEWFYNEDAGLMERKYDPNSIILPNITAAEVNLNSNSFVQVFDNVLQRAYSDLLVGLLNHKAKQALMEETDVDFIEVRNPSPGLLAAFNALPEFRNYASEEVLFDYNGDLYFAEYDREDVDNDGDNEVDIDENEREIEVEVLRFFKADTSDVDVLYGLINWDYEFTANTYDFAANTATYGSIIGQLNHLLFVILDTILSQQAKDAIADFNNTPTFFTDGGNEELGGNLINIVKYALCEYANKFFYKNPDYVDEDGVALPSFVNEVKAITTFESLAAYLALDFMYDILPELILPVSFTPGLEVEQIATLALREALSDITPVVNFDDRIFKPGTLTSATGRELADLDQDEWVDLILDMAMNLAVIYLDNKTNIDLDSDAAAAIYAEAEALTGAGWRGLFEEVVDWGIHFIGTGSISLLNGCGPTQLGSVRGTYNGNAFNNVNKVLNTLLPLSIVNGCADGTYACNVETLVFDKLLAGVLDLDLGLILSIFGRSGTADNPLTSSNAVNSLLVLVRRVINCVLPGAIPNSNISNLQNFTSKPGLKALIKSLLASLSTYVYASTGTAGGETGLLYGRLLPIIAGFKDDWSGEQTLGSLDLEIDTCYTGTSGAATGSFVIRNGADGVWRNGYDVNGVRYQDEHYKYKVTGLTASSTGGTVSTNFAPAELNLGQTMTVNITASGVPAAGAVATFDIDYQVYNEEGELMAGGQTFSSRTYAYISYNPAKPTSQITICERTTTFGGTSKVHLYSPFYVAIENGKNVLPTLTTFRFESTYSSGDCWGAIQSCTPATQSGITLNAIPGAYNDGATTVTPGQSLYFEKFTVNSDEYDAANIEPGTTFTWAVRGQAWVKKPTFGNPGSNSGTQNLVVRMYSSEDVSDVKDIAAEEISQGRLAAEYHTGTVYANKVLRAAYISEEEPKQTNFATTGVDPETGETVTIIDGAQAWANYQAALNAAIIAAYQPWNDNSVYDQAARAEALEIAASDIKYCAKTTEEIIAEGGTNNDVAVLALKDLYETYRPLLNSYKDYMLYRWDRFEDAEGPAVSLINLYKAAKAVIDTEVFPYGKISITELDELLAIDDVYANYINALREDRTEAQIEASELSKENAIKSYTTGYTALDVENITSNIVRTYGRLLPREGGTITAYLEAELDSALAIHGDAPTSAVYSEKSWNLYLERLATAQAELLNPKNNETVFDAKYHLQRAVNELIPIDEGADYSGLEDAIATAEAVLANHELFSHGQDKSIGLVLAALGYTIDETELFPGAAKDVVKKVYDVEDQRKIDDAELRLRLALAEVRYDTTEVEGNEGASTEIQEETDAYYAFVPANLAIANVFGYLDAITVPVNITDVMPITITPNATHAGTGTVVTFYGKLAGVSIPVASYSVVVIGDVTGDSAIDAADVMVADLVVNEHNEIDGAFLKAALADPATAVNNIVTIEALSEIVNIAVGNAD